MITVVCIAFLLFVTGIAEMLLKACVAAARFAWLR
jgi:hypothetical protein